MAPSEARQGWAQPCRASEGAIAKPGPRGGTPGHHQRQGRRGLKPPHAS
jgi:hypothetical protein